MKLACTEGALRRLYHEVLALREEFKLQVDGGKAPKALRAQIADRLEAYIRRFETCYAAYSAAYGKRKYQLGAELVRDFELGLWHILAQAEV